MSRVEDRRPRRPGDATGGRALALLTEGTFRTPKAASEPIALGDHQPLSKSKIAVRMRTNRFQFREALFPLRNLRAASERRFPTGFRAVPDSQNDHGGRIPWLVVMTAMRLLIAVMGVLTVCGCSHDIRLAFPNAAAQSNEFTCSVSEGPLNCTSGGVHNPADDNRQGTVTVIMPPSCARIHQITIHDAGSSKPTAHVLCAPAEGTIAQPDVVN